MKKAIELFKQGFESSSTLTPEFSAFFKTFKKEFTAELKKMGCTKIEIGRGHFYISGFFTSQSGQIYYFSLSDVRSGYEYNSLLYRTAKDYKDFTGGSNQFTTIQNFTAEMRLK
jgi:hypothetical protein